uniref:Nuclear egress membrane protein n=1 Tax=Cardioderma bat herpesvirus TaxID=3141914 RepID=A0AAU7E0Y2_9VIRU
MAVVDKFVQADLIAATQRILRLGSNEVRVTDNALICKNPNYSLCDAMLKVDVVYFIEYLLSYWEARSGHVPCFVFKNTGCAASLCCYLRAPTKALDGERLKEFNVLRVNESLIVTLKDIEQMKPSARGVLTNCVVRRSACGSSFSVEFITFGPENETEYENLLRDLYAKKTAPAVTVSDPFVGTCQASRREQTTYVRRRGRSVSRSFRRDRGRSPGGVKNGVRSRSRSYSPDSSDECGRKLSPGRRSRSPPRTASAPRRLARMIRRHHACAVLTAGLFALLGLLALLGYAARS